MERDTIGKISSDLLLKADDKHTVIDQTRENLKEFEKEFMICLERGKKLYSHQNQFFIEVQIKKEKLMENVQRNYFIPKIACPTPTWDQHVYLYRFIDDSIEYIWSVPDRDTCQYMTDHALQIPPEERQLLQFVLDFRAGDLDQRARDLNGENGISAILFKQA